MKSRLLDKLYQMMRVSRFYFKHKSLIAGTPAAKRVIKSYNEKMDNLLVYALKQKKQIKYGEKQKNNIREEFKHSLLMTVKLSGWCLPEANNYI